MLKSWLLSEKLLFGMVVFLAIFIPLYPKFPLFNVEGTFAAVRLEDILIAFTFCLWFLHLYFFKNLKDFFGDRLNQGLLIFFFVGLVSTVSAIFLTQTVVPHLNLIHLLRRIEIMLLLPLAVYAVNSKQRLLILLAALFVVLVLVNFYALGQRFLDWPVVSTTNSEFSKGLILRLTPGARVNSTFAGHYDFAVFLVMALTIMSAYFFAVKKIWLQLVYILIGGLSFVVLVLTAARQSFVAAVAGILISLILTGKRLLILALLGLAVLAVVIPSPLRDRLVSTAIVSLNLDSQKYVSDNPEHNKRGELNIPTLQGPRITSLPESTQSATQLASDITPGEPTDQTQLEVSRSLGIRLNIEWPRAIRAFVKNPLLGTGYSSIGLATDNDFLRSLGEVGLLGTTAFILIFVVIIRKIWKGFKSSLKLIKFFSAGVLAMIFAFVLNGAFIDVFEASKIASIFWIIVGSSIGVLKSERDL